MAIFYGSMLNMNQITGLAGSIDMDISNAKNMVVAAGFNTSGKSYEYYQPYTITLNKQTGVLTDTLVIKGDAGAANYIQAVESMEGAGVITGGNLNSIPDGEKKGFLLLKRSLASTPALH